MGKFRKNNRLVKYDYSQPGYYFITICTDNKIEYFGTIRNGEMALSAAGRIARQFWKNTPVCYQNADIDEYVVMPNHLHGIIIIKDRQAGGLHYNLSQIVGSYKNTVTKNIRSKLKMEFGWQPSFYDHVIRKDESLDKIRKYVRNNPLKWELDRNNTSNLWM
jgi:putative transposase